MEVPVKGHSGPHLVDILEYNDGIIDPRLIYVSGRRSLAAWRRMQEATPGRGVHELPMFLYGGGEAEVPS